MKSKIAKQLVSAVIFDSQTGEILVDSAPKSVHFGPSAQSGPECFRKFFALFVHIHSFTPAASFRLECFPVVSDDDLELPFEPSPSVVDVCNDIVY